MRKLLPALALLGCMGDPSGLGVTASGSVRGEVEPVIVTVGGYSSCLGTFAAPTPAGSARWASSARLSARFARDEARWVRGCFDARGRLHWISSADPARVSVTTADALGPFVAAVAERAGGERRPVYLHGHSYGAWVAARTASTLPASVAVRMLVTVDPISPWHCTPASYFRAAAAPVAAPWLLAGCQRAPTDLSADERRGIVARLPEGGWRHYYQRNFLPLRSGPFDAPGAPHRSYDVSAFLSRNGGAHPSWNAHVGIDELAVVWFTLEQSIDYDLGAQ
jgi:pimeloyl-ACP methyl ester carboxylesterase